jgi:hypothetical protein
MPNAANKAVMSNQTYGWRLQMVVGWFAFKVYMVLPILCILPYAGFYAYDTPEIRGKEQP